MRLTRLVAAFSRFARGDDTMRLIKHDDAAPQLTDIPGNAVDAELRRLLAQFGSLQWVIEDQLRAHHQLETEISAIEARLQNLRLRTRHIP